MHDNVDSNCNEFKDQVEHCSLKNRSTLVEKKSERILAV